MLIPIFTIKLGHKIDPRTAIEDILVLQQAKTLEMLVIIAWITFFHRRNMFFSGSSRQDN